MSDLETLKDWMEQSEHAVFLGGAGVSTESGIPDFRSQDGLYSQKWDYPPEEILSAPFFKRYTEKFYDFYRSKMLFPDVQPNMAHKALAYCEQQGHLTAVVTQNIDGLHQKAGSQNVLELHGSVLRNYCMSCRRFYSLDEIIHGTGVPHCECGGIIKPDVVLYGESLPEDVLSQAVMRIREADLFIVGGTSLNVYPAAGLIDYYKGNRLVLINKSATPYDRYANLHIMESIGETLGILLSDK